MTTVSEWMKKNMPDTYEFIRNFFKALNNRPGGHSLRKLLAVGFFWLIAIIVLRYTDTTNAVAMAGVLSGMITTLIVTYSVSNYQERKNINGKADNTLNELTDDQETSKS